MPTGTERAPVLGTSNDSIRVQIGDVCCSLRCNDGEVLGNWQQQYADFLSDKPADISIEVEFVERLTPAEIKTALAEARFIHDEGRFTTTNGIITGEYDLTGRTMRWTADKHLLDPDLEFKAINRLFTLAYYTACKVRYSGNLPAFLVHSCGILRHGQALLFGGACDVGKSTIARLCGDEYGQVVNDEMVLVSRPDGDNSALRVQGVPMLGDFPQRLNKAAPLSCILLLKQSKRTAVRRLDRTEAYLRFMRQIICPAYIGQTDRRAVYSLIAEFSDEVIRTTPFYELEFSLDRELLWKAVGELERSIGERGKLDGNPDSQG